jgi:hypothetical protein
VDRWHSFEYVAGFGVRDFESKAMRIPGRRSPEMPLNIGVGSWPWVILRVELEEKEANLRALESMHVVVSCAYSLDHSLGKKAVNEY